MIASMVYWPRCGANCFETAISPCCTAATTGVTAYPPSLLATVLLLQAHDRVSDAEAKARADFEPPLEGSPGDRGGG